MRGRLSFPSVDDKLDDSCQTKTDVRLTFDHHLPDLEVNHREQTKQECGDERKLEERCDVAHENKAGDDVEVPSGTVQSKLLLLVQHATFGITHDQLEIVLALGVAQRLPWNGEEVFSLLVARLPFFVVDFNFALRDIRRRECDDSDVR